MIRIFAATIFVLLTAAVPAQAVMVDGTFSGTIYPAQGITNYIPITGTFEYNTASYTYSAAGSTSFNSIFAPTSTNAITITETSELGTYVFSYTTDQALFIEPFQINFGAAQNGSSSNYTSIDVIFPSNAFILKQVPQQFAVTNLPPFQGSNETYVNGQAYDFYISNIEASPTPLPDALSLFGAALAGLGAAAWIRRRAKA